MKESNNIKVLMLSSKPSKNKAHKLPFITRQIKFLREEGIDVDDMWFIGGKNIINYIHAWIEIQKRINNLHYDLIHSQFGHFAFLTLFPKRLPLVVTFRGSDVMGFEANNKIHSKLYGFTKILTRFAATQADEIIVVSESLISHLPKREYHIIPSGIDLKIFFPISKNRARHLLGYNSDYKYVLFSGSQNRPVKRYALAEEVINILKKIFPNISLIVLDSVPYENVYLYMNACDALLVTSLHEGSPNMVKEALACNLPIVSTDVGDVRNRIQKIDGCEICDNDLPETIAKALQKILINNSRIDSQNAVRNLDETILTKEIIKVYKLVTDNKTTK